MIAFRTQVSEVKGESPSPGGGADRMRISTTPDVRCHLGRVCLTFCRFRFQCGTGGFSGGFFGFNWDSNLALVPIETENPTSGEGGLSFKGGLPALAILVGDLLLSGSNRLPRRAHSACRRLLRLCHPSPVQAFASCEPRAQRVFATAGFGGPRSQGSETRRQPSTEATPFDLAVLKAECRRLWPHGRRQCPGTPATPSAHCSDAEIAGG